MTKPFVYYGKTSHPDCSPKAGHVCGAFTGQLCWTEGCKKRAGTIFAPYWCPDHDAHRRDRINKAMEEIATEQQQKIAETAVQATANRTEDNVDENVDENVEEISRTYSDEPVVVDEKDSQCEGVVASGARCSRTGIPVGDQEGVFCKTHQPK